MMGFVFFIAFVLFLGVASALGWTVDSREPSGGFFAGPPGPREPRQSRTRRR